MAFLFFSFWVGVGGEGIGALADTSRHLTGSASDATSWRPWANSSATSGGGGTSAASSTHQRQDTMTSKPPCSTRSLGSQLQAQARLLMMALQMPMRESNLQGMFTLQL